MHIWPLLVCSPRDLITEISAETLFFIVTGLPRSTFGLARGLELMDCYFHQKPASGSKFQNFISSLEKDHVF